MHVAEHVSICRWITVAEDDSLRVEGERVDRGRSLMHLDGTARDLCSSDMGTPVLRIDDDPRACVVAGA